MYIKEMQIRNFKNFKKARFNFKTGINTIIGENDSGKSNALYAIRLILDRKLNWNEKEINEEMFAKSLSSWKGHCIIISLRFAELGDSEHESIFKYSTINSNGEGSLTWFCMPNEEKSKLLHDASVLGEEQVKEILEKMTINDYVSFVTCGAEANFLDDSIYEKIVGNPENSIYNYSELDDALIGCREKKNFGIEEVKKNLVDFTYIDALRNAEDDLKKQYNPLMTILKSIESLIPESNKEVVKTLVTSINKEIDNVGEIKKLTKQINIKIMESVGNTYAPDISLSSELSEDMNSIFRSLKLKGVNNSNIGSIGLGSTNIIYIALKLLEFSYLQELNGIQDKYFLLLFEEPEAHLHKHIQMSLFLKTGLENKRVNSQIIITTHSDHISAASKISSMNVISQTDGGNSIVMNPSNNLNEDQITRIERYLDSKRSSLLFSKNVILVEGDAEEIIIPIILKKVLGVSLDEIGTSLINIGSVGFRNLYMLFDDKRIQKRCAIITDLDEDIDSVKISDANKLGIKRKQDIDDEASKNNWIRGFYAQHTFEIELVKKNECYFHDLIDKIYKDANTIKEKKNLIDSADVADYGKAINSFARQNGKGWNAIILGDSIDSNFYIPDYILDALVFSGHNAFSENVIRTILSHFYKSINQKDIVIELNNGTYDNEIKLTELIKYTIDKYPDKTVSKIIKKRCLRRQENV